MEIKCNYQDLNWIQSEYLYTCKITSSSVKEPNQVIKVFIGKHQPRKTDRDVEVIWFNCTKVHFIPRGLSKIFPNLKVVEKVVDHCGLKEISREDLVGFENIETLNLSDNQLISLPDDLLEGMKKLKVIKFSNNKLEFVSSQLHQPVLNQLTYASFWRNLTISATFNAFKVNLSDDFVDLLGLMELIDKKCKKPLKKILDVKSSVEMLKNKMFQAFGDFWTSGQISDFTIIVGDKKFKVHKTVLAMQSEYFAETFNKADYAIAELKNEAFSVEAVEAVLNWMYTGDIPNVKNAAEILYIAMKLKISTLNPIAEELLQVYLKEENAMEVLKLGHRNNCEKLKKSAYKVVKNFLADPNLGDEMMDELEKLEKLVEVKKNYEAIKKSCQKRKLNGM